jgi:hypothetical protein
MKRRADPNAMLLYASVRKNASFWAFFILKMIIILPRQARDKHGNTLKKKAFCAERPLRPDVWQRPCEHGHDGRLDPRYEEKRTFCTAIRILKNDHFTKTGSGQT